MSFSKRMIANFSKATLNIVEDALVYDDAEYARMVVERNLKASKKPGLREEVERAFTMAREERMAEIREDMQRFARTGARVPHGMGPSTQVHRYWIS